MTIRTRIITTSLLAATLTTIGVLQMQQSPKKQIHVQFQNSDGSVQTITTPDNYTPPVLQPQPTTTSNSTTDALQTASGVNVAQPAANTTGTPVAPAPASQAAPPATRTSSIAPDPTSTTTTSTGSTFTFGNGGN